MDTHMVSIWSWYLLGIDDKALAHQHPQYWLNILRMLSTGLTKTDISYWKQTLKWNWFDEKIT